VLRVPGAKSCMFPLAYRVRESGDKSCVFS